MQFYYAAGRGSKASNLCSCVFHSDIYASIPPLMLLGINNVLNLESFSFFITVRFRHRFIDKYTGNCDFNTKLDDVNSLVVDADSCSVIRVKYNGNDVTAYYVNN